MILRKLIASVMAATMALTPSVAVFAQTHQEPLNLNLPSMGSVAGTDLSPLEEQMLGEEIMSQIRADDAYLNDAETLDYLNHLGYRWVSDANAHTYNFFFFPIIDHSLNAFALPGGFIAVHSGLVVAAQSESELAGVVGHEIGVVVTLQCGVVVIHNNHTVAIHMGSLRLCSGVELGYFCLQLGLLGLIFRTSCLGLGLASLGFRLLTFCYGCTVVSRIEVIVGAA